MPSRNDKIRQSDSPVDVPRTPDDKTHKGDEANTQSKPVQDTTEGSSWADTAKPAPRKHKARTHQF